MVLIMKIMVLIMKQMVNNKKIFLLIGLIAITLLIFLFSSSEKEFKGGVYFHCSTTFQMKYNNPDFAAKVNVFLQLQKNERGLFDITGKADVDGENFDIARTYHFNYEKQSGSVYHLTDITTSRRNYENVDDVLMNSLFFSTTQEDGRYLRMTKMENSYVIGNLHSPVFICIVR